MKILSANVEAAIECAKYLADGEPVIYPTETVYGLGADVTNKNAVDRIFSAKGRDSTKAVSIAVANVAQAKELAEFDPVAEKLAEKFLPGPLTLILKSKIDLPNVVVDGKIGIRIPENDFVQKLIRIFRRPIISTSANLSGKKEPTNISEVDEKLFDRIKVLVDGGQTKYRKSSTVVESLGAGMRILREGAISKQQIEDALK